jgi:RNA polymerase sigma-70 factor (ECF subfamily)
MDRITRQTTTTLLLESLKDPGRDAVWREFDARYRPVLCAIARKVGLKPAEAEEIAQETLAEFVRAYREGKYDRTKGRLSSWIIAIARHRIAMRWRSKGRAKEKRGDSALGELNNRTHLTRVWAAEQERVIFARAWEMLRTTGRTAEKTLKAFELVAMRGMPAAAAAADCGMTLEEVYIAKNRVTKRLRELVEELTAAYGEDS